MNQFVIHTLSEEEQRTSNIVDDKMPPPILTAMISNENSITSE